MPNSSHPGIPVKLLLVTLCALSAACATAAPEAPAPPAPAPVQAANPGLGIYEGTYALQGPGGELDVRVWRDAEGRLNGELVGRGRQTVFRPTGTPHRFLHETSDNVSFQFTVENGRATSLTMTQGERQISGPRKP